MQNKVEIPVFFVSVFAKTFFSLLGLKIGSQCYGTFDNVSTCMFLQHFLLVKHDLVQNILLILQLLTFARQLLPYVI